jgi:hypothetical protein
MVKEEAATDVPAVLSAIVDLGATLRQNASAMLSPLSGGDDPRMVYAARKRMFKPGRGLSDGERALFQDMKERLGQWLAPRVDPDIGPLMMPVLVSMASRDAGLSRNAVADVVRRTLRGEVEKFDLHFAPSPAEIASEARKVEASMAFQIERLGEALEARELTGVTRMGG